MRHSGFLHAHRLRRLSKPLCLLLTLICGCLSTRLVAASESGERPNIIFIYADDWGWGDLPSHGHPYLKTPNLDRLLSEGTDIHQFYSASPVCSASRVAVMTGQYPARHSVHQHFWNADMHRRMNQVDWLNPRATMLPRVLQQAGYRTGHFGKWHLTSEMIRDAPPTSAYGYDESEVFRGPGPQIHPDNAIRSAIHFIHQNRGRPFFINLWIHETHAPNYPRTETLERFSHLPEQEKVYAATIADADERIGNLLDTLDELGLADNTLIAFSSDNGPEMLSVNGDDAKTFKYVAGYPDSPYGSYYCVGSSGGLRARKRSLYEGGVRVPLIVRWPGRIPAGRVDEKTVMGTVDLLPTFCAAAGVPLPSGYAPDGENMLPALSGAKAPRQKPLYWDWSGYSVGDNWPRLAVREGDWKLLMTYDASRVELYRIPEDHSESRDLAAAKPDVVERLKRKVLAWKQTLPVEPPEECITKWQP